MQRALPFALVDTTTLVIGLLLYHVVKFSCAFQRVPLALRKIWQRTRFAGSHRNAGYYQKRPEPAMAIQRILIPSIHLNRTLATSRICKAVSPGSKLGSSIATGSAAPARMAILLTAMSAAGA